MPMSAIMGNANPLSYLVIPGRLQLTYAPTNQGVGGSNPSGRANSVKHLRVHRLAILVNNQAVETYQSDT